MRVEPIKCALVIYKNILNYCTACKSFSNSFICWQSDGSLTRNLDARWAAITAIALAARRRADPTARDHSKIAQEHAHPLVTVYSKWETIPCLEVSLLIVIALASPTNCLEFYWLDESRVYCHRLTISERSFLSSVNRHFHRQSEEINWCTRISKQFVAAEYKNIE